MLVIDKNAVSSTALHVMGFMVSRPGGRLKNADKLIYLGALKTSNLNKPHFQCMGKVFCVEF